MHWDFSEIALVGMGFGQKSSWEVGFWQNLGWEMGFIPPFRTLEAVQGICLLGKTRDESPIVSHNTDENVQFRSNCPGWAVTDSISLLHVSLDTFTWPRKETFHCVKTHF